MRGFKEEIRSRPLLYAAVFFLIAALCISFSLDWLGETGGNFWAQAALRFIFSVIGIILMIRSGLSDAFKIGKDAVKNWDITLVGLLIAINNFPAIALITGKAAVTANTPAIISYVLFCFSVGLFEEIFFRGLLFPIFLIYFNKKKLGDFWALIVSSAVFALAHLLNLFSGASFGTVFLQVGYTFLTGLVFALIFYFTKTLYFSILCHTLFDVGGLLIGSIGTGAIWDTATIILTAVLERRRECI